MATTKTFSATKLAGQYYGTSERISYTQCHVNYYSSNATSKQYAIGVIGIPSLTDIDWSTKKITKIVINYTPTSSSAGSSFFFWRSRVGEYDNWSGAHYINTTYSYTQISTGTYTAGSSNSITVQQSSNAANFRWMCKWIKSGVPFLCLTLDSSKNGAESNANRMILDAFSLTITYEDWRADTTYTYPCTLTAYEAPYYTGNSSSGAPTVSAGGGSRTESTTTYRVGYYSGSTSYYYKRVMITVPAAPYTGQIQKRYLRIYCTTNAGIPVCFGKVSDTSNLTASWWGTTTDVGSSTGWIQLELGSWSTSQTAATNFAIWPNMASYRTLALVITKAELIIQTDVQTYNLTYDLNGGSGTWPSQSTLGATFSNSKPTWTIAENTAPTRTNYTFLGWSTSSTATAATYQSGDSVSPASTGTPYYYAHDLTLYAVWEKIIHTMTYHHYLDSVSNKTVEVEQGDVFYPLKQYNDSGTNPTMRGHTFMGWLWTNALTNLSGDEMAAQWDGGTSVFKVGEDEERSISPTKSWNFYSIWKPNGNVYVKKAKGTANSAGVYNELELSKLFVYRENSESLLTYKNGAGITRYNGTSVPYPQGCTKGTEYAPEFFFTGD